MKLLNSVSEYHREYYRGFTLWLWVVIYAVAACTRDGIFLILAGDLFWGSIAILIAIYLWWSETKDLPQFGADDESD